MHHDVHARNEIATTERRHPYTRQLDAVKQLRDRPTLCKRCSTLRATHLVGDARHALCNSCAYHWSRISPLERRRRLLDAVTAPVR